MKCFKRDILMQDLSLFLPDETSGIGFGSPSLPRGPPVPVSPIGSGLFRANGALLNRDFMTFILSTVSGPEFCYARQLACAFSLVFFNSLFPFNQWSFPICGMPRNLIFFFWLIITTENCRSFQGVNSHISFFKWKYRVFVVDVCLLLLAD